MGRRRGFPKFRQEIVEGFDPLREEGQVLITDGIVLVAGIDISSLEEAVEAFVLFGSLGKKIGYAMGDEGGIAQEPVKTVGVG